MLMSTLTGSITPILNDILDKLKKPRPLRIAVMGIGNELRGDDAAGLYIARGLLEKQSTNESERAGTLIFMAIEAGPAPENYTHLLRSFQPDLVLLADAANMDEEPGTVRLIGLEEIATITPSTHSLPLDLLVRYLTSEIGCQVLLIGIQPENNDFGAALSEPVRIIVQGLIEDLSTINPPDRIDHTDYRHPGIMYNDN